MPKPKPDSALGRLLAGLGKFGPFQTIAALGLGFGLVALVGFVQVSSTPTFCGSCHIMKPYYASWKHSGHNKIACVECHISPGITAEVRKKFEALSMVAKYFTGTYGTKPWAEVDDAACLRCHERRLLEGKVDFEGVNFDHRPHMTESRRGLRLRCTSCHSQIVQGTHLTVTVSTCALCHFKDQPPNRELGACRRCHDVPDRVRTPAGNPFDHTQVATMDISCSSCHGGVVRGDGRVPRRRCQSCHNQADRLEKYGETLFLHRKHVTEHKVDCQECHDEIDHGIPSGMAPASAHAGLASGGGSCQSCHGDGHSPQQMLYAGIGARGVPPMPGPMAAVGVTCQGCHNPEFSVRVAAFGPQNPYKVPAGVVSCMACHGPSYTAIYRAWTEGVEQRTRSLRQQVEATAPAMASGAPKAWQDARWNLDLVSEGRGIHNINYAYTVLDKAFEQMNEARKAKGMAPLSRPWTVITGGECLNCHLGIERQSGTFEGNAYSHAPHVEKAHLPCETCHRRHEERPKFEVVRFGSEGCSSCHHKKLEPGNFQQCAACHGDVTKRTYTTFRGEFSHQQHLDVGEECKSCHKIETGDPRPARSHCSECHD